ncbi:hypothetical protein [Alkalihalobacillus sp. BA299]|uniref:hypothetical protein n=1 Tax=Alkalihalobacillus sp. BA299 TaxID=2815938 RepID=UPI001ADCA1C1|nr:hypothetical protein [Alkalihalobacillus sp. BA299]
MISISGLLSISFIVVYFLLEWYAQQLSYEAHAQKKGDYVPDSDYQIKTNPDGTNDYSELYADAIEERKKARRAAVETSNIKGTETESLLSSLQQELEDDSELQSLVSSVPPEEDIEDNQPLTNEEDIKPHFQEQEPIELENSIDEEIKEREKPIPKSENSFDIQERIYELRNRLSEFSKEEADMVDIEAMIMTQYELFQLEGREDQVRQLEEDFFMYFPKSSSHSTYENIPKVYEEDILTLEDMEMEREQPSPKSPKHSTSRISDNILGLQRWRGRVIGKAGDYIHFQDYSRIWIKAGNKINKINVGDELILEVLRSDSEVIMKQMFRVKNKNSQPQSEVVNQ